MTPEQMLKVLDEIGADNGADLDDSEENGPCCFGWSIDVEAKRLTITYEPIDDVTGAPTGTQTAVFALVPAPLGESL